MRIRVLVFCLLSVTVQSASGQTLEDAFDKLYSFDFSGAHETLDRVEAGRPRDPMVHVARASAYLFGEMDRIGILATEFYRGRGKKLRDLKFEPSAAARESIQASLAETRDLARRRIAGNPKDADAQFALALAAGIESNYAIFIERKRLGALSLARLSHKSAQRVIDTDPNYHDAYLVTGLSEYVAGSVPFFARWIVGIYGVDGNKQKGISSLQDVARSGRYLATLAKITLVTIYLREKRYEEARAIAEELVEQFPDNPQFGKELELIETSIRRLARTTILPAGKSGSGPFSIPTSLPDSSISRTSR